MAPLHCAALLVQAAANPSNDGDIGSHGLWLIDATGSYPVRAMALGGDMEGVQRPNDNDDDSAVPTTVRLNKAIHRIDWTRMAAEEGLRLLLETLHQVLPPSDGAYGVEAAVMDFDRRQMVHKFVKDL